MKNLEFTLEQMELGLAAAEAAHQAEKDEAERLREIFLASEGGERRAARKAYMHQKNRPVDAAYSIYSALAFKCHEMKKNNLDVISGIGGEQVDFMNNLINQVAA